MLCFPQLQAKQKDDAKEKLILISKETCTLRHKSTPLVRDAKQRTITMHYHLIVYRKIQNKVFEPQNYTVFSLVNQNFATKNKKNKIKIQIFYRI